MPLPHTEMDRRLYQAIGCSIRSLRTERGLTQAALGAAIGAGKRSASVLVSRAEHGRQHFTVAEVYRYAKGLDADPRDLLPPAWRILLEEEE